MLQVQFMTNKYHLSLKEIFQTPQLCHHRSAKLVPSFDWHQPQLHSLVTIFVSSHGLELFLKEQGSTSIPDAGWTHGSPRELWDCPSLRIMGEGVDLLVDLCLNVATWFKKPKLIGALQTSYLLFFSQLQCFWSSTIILHESQFCLSRKHHTYWWDQLLPATVFNQAIFCLGNL